MNTVISATSTTDNNLLEQVGLTWTEVERTHGSKAASLLPSTLSSFSNMNQNDKVAVSSSLLTWQSATPTDVKLKALSEVFFLYDLFLQ